MTLDQILLKHGIDPSSIRCGAAVGQGWVPLIDQALTELKAAGWNGTIAQIKEKFGTLRIYASGTDQQQEIVHNAESKSAETCEDCGGRGSLTSIGFWMRTLCSECKSAANQKQQNLYGQSK